MKQISVIANNRMGLVAEITTLLAGHEINIISLDAESVDDNAVVVLTVAEYEDAFRLLQSMDDVSVISEDIILVKLTDKPGALAEVAARFKDAGVAMQSMHIIGRGPEQSVVAISAERASEARELVEDLLIS